MNNLKIYNKFSHFLLKSYSNNGFSFSPGWTPSFPEPVYIPTGLEMEPLYPNSKEDTVVYLAEDGGYIVTHVAIKYSLVPRLMS